MLSCETFNNLDFSTICLIIRHHPLSSRRVFNKRTRRPRTKPGLMCTRQNLYLPPFPPTLIQQTMSNFTPAGLRPRFPKQNVHAEQYLEPQGCSQYAKTTGISRLRISASNEKSNSITTAFEFVFVARGWTGQDRTSSQGLHTA